MRRRHSGGGQVAPTGGAADAAGSKTGSRQPHRAPQNQLRRYRSSWPEGLRLSAIKRTKKKLLVMH